jgi:predicted N-acyltransferase
MVRDPGGRALAVLPAYLQASMDPLGILAESIPTTDWTDERGVLSHVWHCYDTRLPSITHPREVAGAVCSTLAEVACERGAAWYGFVNVEGSQDLICSLRSEGLSAHYMWDRFVLDLSGLQTVDDYLRSLRKKARHELRRQYRRAVEAGATTTVLSPPFGEVGDVVELMRLTAGKHGTDFYYPAETLGTFLQNVGPTARIVCVRLEEALIGAWICFVDGDRFHTWAAGARYDATSFSPYYVGYYDALRLALSTKARILEGGRGNGKIKERNGMKPIPLYALLARP